MTLYAYLMFSLRPFVVLLTFPDAVGNDVDECEEHLALPEETTTTTTV
jgi:hypothetical protein